MYEENNPITQNGTENDSNYAPTPQPEVTAQPVAQPEVMAQPVAQPEVMAQPAAEPSYQQVAQPVYTQRAEAPAPSYAEPQTNTGATGYHVSPPQKSNTRREKKSLPFGFAVAMVLVCCVLALGAGFGGGIWAADRIEQRLNADINENISSYLEENGSTVLYRSVDTNIENVSVDPAEKDGESLVTSVAELAADSVVEITTEVVTENIYSFFGMGGKSVSQGAGSGVILSDDGYILTCYHVIQDATTIGVSLRDGTQYEATLIGGDEELDIAVIKIEASGLTPAVLGSSDALVVGSPVVAIGNPLGQLGGTVTSGYISALDRTLVIEEHTYNLLQTDAAINGGNSGGGLFNAKGELVGLVNAKAESIGVEGLGFAIPVDDIAQDIEDLINYGYITSRVTLGVTMVDIWDQRTALAYRVDEYGVYILNVVTGSNAEVAGLQAGDRIINIDGEIIESGDQVVDIISTYSVGEVMDMTIKRGGEEMQVQITMYGALTDPKPSTPVSSSNEEHI